MLSFIVDDVIEKLDKIIVISEDRRLNKYNFDLTLLNPPHNKSLYVYADDISEFQIEAAYNN